MIGNLHIENIAIMDNVNLDLESGFVALTGETGAGKSIIIDSVNLLTGERSSRELLRRGCDKALVEGTVYTDSSEVFSLLDENGISYTDGDPIILSREINKDGRSMVRINGRSATTGLLRDICSKIINIHGQHDNQEIFSAAYHSKLTDSFAELDNELLEYGVLYNKYKSIESKLSESFEDEKIRREKAEILAYKINEIKSAGISAGELDALKKQRETYLNNEKITNAITEGCVALNGDESDKGALELVTDACECLEELTHYSVGADGLFDKLSEIKYTLMDVAESVRDLKNELEDEEINIDEVEGRIYEISGVLRKYGPDEGDALENLAQMEQELSDIDNFDANREKLEKEFKELEKELIKKASELTEKRKNAASRLEKLVTEQLQDLDMKNAVFGIDIQKGGLGASGWDKTEFLISTNKGEPLKPLTKIASGGELSRVILALKVILAKSDSVSTMIFDEVDAGVSGAAARKIAEKLKAVSENKQVIVITHLAQIASLADYHYLIEKETKGDKTVSDVKLLDKEGRIDEIARIISGGVMTKTAVATAEEMIYGG